MPKGAREGGKPAAVLKAQRGAKKGTQKGRTRHFTSPEELAAQAAQLDIEREGGDRIREPKAEGASSSDSGESSSASESESDEEVEKTKGVSALIEIENPNRVAVKNKKISELTIDTTAVPTLSRREREEIEKESQKKLHEQLRAEGKTEQARADLARLAIIRQEREQAAKKRAAEQQVKDAARATKAEATPSLKKDDPSSSGKK